MTPDLVNGLFELGGAVVLWQNVATLYRDKSVKGVHPNWMIFFFLWSAWNLFYYPHLEQWWSLCGAVMMIVAQIVWLGQMLYYRGGSNGNS